MYRLSIFVTIAILAVGNSPALPQDLTDGLIACYPFDGDASDMSGHDNHGEPNANMTLTTDRFGNPDSAYYFNGINSHITVPGSSSLDSADTASTQFAWIQLDGYSQVGSSFGPILMKSNSTTNSFMYRLDVGPNGFGVAYGNWDNSAGGTYAVELGTWFCVAAAWDGDTVRFYVDGDLIDEAAITASLSQDGRPLVIGGDYPGWYESFWGKIDEVYVYNRALSGTEIAILSGTQPSPVFDDAPAGIVLFDGYPNPFNPRTMIAFDLPEEMAVNLHVYDVSGRLVDVLLDDRIARQGRNEVVWRGRDTSGRRLPSGTYFYRLEAGGYGETKSVTLLK